MTSAEIALPIVRKMIRFLKAEGYTVRSVYDGEERHNVTTETAAMEVVSSVDDSVIRFQNADDTDGGSVQVILCNDEDVISDWTYTTETAPFNVAMDKFLDTLHS